MTPTHNEQAIFVSFLILPLANSSLFIYTRDCLTEPVFLICASKDQPQICLLRILIPMMWLVQLLFCAPSLCDTVNQIWKVTGCCGDLGESPCVLKTGFECSLSHVVCLLYSQYWNYYFLALEL